MTGGPFLPLPDDWQGQALCAQVDPEIFFPDWGVNPREAKRICARCPVIDECYVHVMSFDHDQEGVWAGLTKRERRKIKKGTKARPEVVA
ncbi:WhiB family transcription factor [Mycobacterium phage LilPharaoh]|uniref:WhiB family transcription factor n=1 Tax=Mycobacterium phage Amelie TaxID=1913035 RepID=A0A1J0GQ37_9CAUD|nr:WhiB family transcription factor [Mycobacterium phage Enkosi]YP_009952564.1 WhiB family transcription factor [Mycobacterium phage Amelie]ATN90499.1 WhiB family transcription factor [Mycobacterium phage LilPharaoh]AVP42623.1 WhiB family transcription factor [Mycobacterium phage SgtBeansprout]AXC37152.1 WhiB family transcription factor [Mycobacterium phage Biglebops]QGJ93331.1 WhiB family transcription factor [Mycobacterium phage Mdavu]UQS94446.1 WhiB family transcription factor [Mycobacteri